MAEFRPEQNRAGPRQDAQSTERVSNIFTTQKLLKQAALIENMKTFEELGLKKEILLALSALKIKEPLEVQEKIIPLSLKGRNVVFTSQTGSGKTLAYSLGF